MKAKKGRTVKEPRGGRRRRQEEKEEEEVFMRRWRQ